MADIRCFWASGCRSWIVYCVDAEGNLLWEADYYPNITILRKSWRKRNA